MAEDFTTEELYVNVNPEYASYSNEVDKPITVYSNEPDPNLPLQYANGEVPAERQAAQADAPDEEKDDDEKKDEVKSTTPSSPQTAPNKVATPPAATPSK